MAFALRNLSVLAYANGFTLWHYKAVGEDRLGVGQPGYFDDAGDMLAGGDMMMVSAVDGGHMLCMVADEAGLRAIAMGGSPCP
jgi:hypothetical protein